MLQVPVSMKLSCPDMIRWPMLKLSNWLSHLLWKKNTNFLLGYFKDFSHGSQNKMQWIGEPHFSGMSTWRNSAICFAYTLLPWRLSQKTQKSRLLSVTISLDTSLKWAHWGEVILPRSLAVNRLWPLSSWISCFRARNCYCCCCCSLRIQWDSLRFPRPASVLLVLDTQFWLFNSFFSLAHPVLSCRAQTNMPGTIFLPGGRWLHDCTD